MQAHRPPASHCVVPGGGLSPDGARWIACRPNFFLPIHVLSRFYRRLFLDRLQAAFDAGRLRFFADMARLAEARAFAAQTKRLRKISWVVLPNRRSAPPTMSRARALHPSRGDRQQPARRPSTSGPVRARLSTGEPKQADDARRTRVHPPHPAPRPARRIPPHVTLANGHRQSKLALIRRLLDQPAPLPTRRSEDYRERVRELTGVESISALLWRQPCASSISCRDTWTSAANPPAFSRPMPASKDQTQ